ncbi:hypothetical protein A3K86_03110 [Photobacterium jeanii]|uniref:Cation tolerance protein CutA n=2 Tax=Photobacterium jeanii TaxID=858640 RepID=A0A178KKZ7_9GAMM|nr:hypothetical protein A3K86_03110 [Photobacterium jeanii]
MNNKTHNTNGDREKIIPGYQGVALIHNGSNITLSVKTPLGRICRYETKFVGGDGHQYLLVELPNISHREMEMSFQEGFNVAIRAISDRGEGAVIKLSSMIDHIITKPIGFIVIDIPHSVTLTQLRSEPRYETRLQGKAIISERQFLIDLNDLSHKGCGFSYSLRYSEIELNEQLVILIQNPILNTQLRLSGKVKSIQKSGAFYKCGVMFDEQGCVSVKQLLSQLIFDGATLTFKKPRLA